MGLTPWWQTQPTNKVINSLAVYFEPMLSTIKKCEIRRLENEVDVVCLATSFCRKGCLSKQSSECIEGP